MLRTSLLFFFIYGFALYISETPFVAADDNVDYGDEGSESFENSDEEDNGSYDGNDEEDRGRQRRNSSSMKSKVRSIVNNLLQLDEDGDSDYGRNGGNISDRRRRNGNFFADNDGGDNFYNGEEEDFRNGRSGRGGNNRKNNGNDFMNDYADESENKAINNRIDSTIKELSTLKKDVNKNFKRRRQRAGNNNGNFGYQRGQMTNNNNIRGARNGAGNGKNYSRSSAARNRARGKAGEKNNNVRKRIFTVKGIDTSNMFTNSYLSSLKPINAKKLRSAKLSQHYESNKPIEYRIKSYTGSGNENKNGDNAKIDSAFLDDKKYTVKNLAYFAHQKGCPDKKCGHV